MFGDLVVVCEALHVEVMDVLEHVGLEEAHVAGVRILDVCPDLVVVVKDPTAATHSDDVAVVVRGRLLRDLVPLRARHLAFAVTWCYRCGLQALSLLQEVLLQL